MLLVPMHLLLALCEGNTSVRMPVYLCLKIFFSRNEHSWPVYSGSPECRGIPTIGSSPQAMVDGDGG